MATVARGAALTASGGAGGDAVPEPESPRDPLSSGIVLCFSALRTRLLATAAAHGAGGGLVMSIGQSAFLRHTGAIFSDLVAKDASAMPEAVKHIENWLVSDVVPERPSNALARLLGPTAVESVLNIPETIMSCQYTGAVLIREVAESTAERRGRLGGGGRISVDVAQPRGTSSRGFGSDDESEGSGGTGAESRGDRWIRLTEWAMVTLRGAWTNPQPSSKHVVRACGQALGAISRVSLISFVQTVRKALSTPDGGGGVTPLGRIGRGVDSGRPAQGVDAIFYALSFGVVPDARADAKQGGGAASSGLEDLLVLLGPFSQLKAPRAPEHFGAVAGALEAVDCILSQITFGGGGGRGQDGHFNARLAARRRLFSARVEPLYTWASTMSRTSDLRIKAAALRAMCAVLVGAPEKFFSERIGAFLAKRALRHLSEPRKAHHSLMLLLKALRGPAPAGCGGRGAGGETRVMLAWDPAGAAWDSPDMATAAAATAHSDRGVYSRTIRGGGLAMAGSLGIALEQIRALSRALFNKRAISRLPYASLPHVVAIGAQIASHSIALAFSETVRPLLPPRPTTHDVRAAGVAFRVVLATINPVFQTEASEAARAARDVETVDEWKRRLQVFVNQLAAEISRTVDACLALLAPQSAATAGGSAVASANALLLWAGSDIVSLAPRPRRWRRQGLCGGNGTSARGESHESIDARSKARQPIRLVVAPTAPAPAAAPPARDNVLPATASVRSMSPGRGGTGQRGDVDRKHDNRNPSAGISAQTLAAALNVLVFVRPPVPLAALGRMLSPGAPVAVQDAAARYVQRAVAYQPESLPTVTFSLIRELIAAQAQPARVATSLLAHTRLACAAWAEACVDAAEAAGGAPGSAAPIAPKWLSSALRSVIPILHAVALAFMAHPAPGTRAAALALTRETSESEQAVLDVWNWAGTAQGDQAGADAGSSDSDTTDHRGGESTGRDGAPAVLTESSTKSTSSLRAFELLQGGEAGEGGLIRRAAQLYDLHYTRWFRPSETTVTGVHGGGGDSVNATPDTPWVATLVGIAAGLGRGRRRRGRDMEVAGEVTELCTGILMALFGEWSDGGASAGAVGVEGWGHTSIVLLMALPCPSRHPTSSNLTNSAAAAAVAGVRSHTKVKRSTGAETAGAAVGRRQWKRHVQMEKKEATRRLEALKSGIRAIRTDLVTLVPDRVTHFRLYARRGAVDVAALVATVMRAFDGSPLGMERLLFAFESAHPAHVCPLLDAVKIYQNVPPPAQKGRLANVEVRLSTGEPLRRRTDAAAFSFFCALAGNSRLGDALHRHGSQAPGLMAQWAMRLTTERVTMWGLGPAATRNAARALRDIAIAMKYSALRQGSTTTLSSALCPADRSQLIQRLLAWAQAASDCLVGGLGLAGAARVATGRSPKGGVPSWTPQPIGESAPNLRAASAVGPRRHSLSTSRINIQAVAPAPTFVSSPARVLPGLVAPVVAPPRRHPTRGAVGPTSPTGSGSQGSIVTAPMRAAARAGWVAARAGSRAEWAIDFAEARRVSLQAVGALLELDSALGDSGNNGLDVDELINSALCTDTQSGSMAQGTRTVAMTPHVLTASRSAMWSKRKQAPVIDSGNGELRSAPHARDGYPVLMSTANARFHDASRCLLRVAYASDPRGGESARIAAFYAVASRLCRPIKPRAGSTGTSNINSGLSSFTGSAQMGLGDGDAKLSLVVARGESSLWLTKLSDSEKDELFIFSVLYAGHPLLDVARAALDMASSLAPLFGSTSPRTTASDDKNSGTWRPHAPIRRKMCASTVRKTAEKIVEFVVASLNGAARAEMGRRVQRRWVHLRHAVVAARERAHEGENPGNDDMEVPLGPADPHLCPARMRHLVLPLHGPASLPPFIATGAALAWTVRAFSTLYRSIAVCNSQHRIQDMKVGAEKDNFGRLCCSAAESVANEELNSVRRLLATSAVCLTGPAEAVPAIETALERLWCVVIQGSDSNNRAARTACILMTALHLCAGGPDGAFSGSFHADCVRNARLDTVQLHTRARPCLDACRIAAAAAQRVAPTEAARVLQWFVQNPTAVAGPWLTGYEHVDKVRGFAAAWAVAAELLTPAIRVENNDFGDLNDRFGLAIHAIAHADNGITASASMNLLNACVAHSVDSSSPVPTLPCGTRCSWERAADPKALSAALSELAKRNGRWRRMLHYGSTTPSSSGYRHSNVLSDEEARVGYAVGVRLRPCASDADWMESIVELLEEGLGKGHSLSRGVRMDSKDKSTARTSAAERRRVHFETQTSAFDALDHNQSVLGTTIFGRSGGDKDSGDEGDDDMAINGQASASGDAILAWLYHDCSSKSGRNRMMSTMLEEALHALVGSESLGGGMTYKWTSLAANYAFIVRDIVSMVNPKISTELHVSARLAEALAHALPGGGGAQARHRADTRKPRQLDEDGDVVEVSGAAERKNPCSDNTEMKESKHSFDGLITTASPQHDLCVTLTQALVARIVSGGRRGGAPDEAAERRHALWAVVCAMETSLDLIFRVGFEGMRVALEPGTACYPPEKPIVPPHARAIWALRIASRGIAWAPASAAALDVVPLTVLLCARGVSGDGWAVGATALLGMCLPWAYALFDAQNPQNTRTTRARALLRDDMATVDPALLCHKVADAVTALGGTSARAVADALRTEAQSALEATEPIQEAIVAALRMMQSAGAGAAQCSRVLGEALILQAARGPPALRQGALRVASTVLSESVSAFGPRSAPLGALLLALSPLASLAVERDGSTGVARDAATAYAWAARAAPSGMDAASSCELGLGATVSVHGDMNCISTAREGLLSLSGGGKSSAAGDAKVCRLPRSYVISRISGFLDALSRAPDETAPDGKARRGDEPSGDVKARAVAVAMSVTTPSIPSKSALVLPRDVAEPSSASTRRPKDMQSPSASLHAGQHQARVRGKPKVHLTHSTTHSTTHTTTGGDSPLPKRSPPKEARLGPASPKVAAQPMPVKTTTSSDGKHRESKPAGGKNASKIAAVALAAAVQARTRSRSPTPGADKARATESRITESEVRDFIRDSGGDDAAECWEEVRSATGDVYYWNTRTDKVQWDRPAALGRADAPPPLSPLLPSGHRRRRSGAAHRRRKSSRAKDPLMGLLRKASGAHALSDWVDATGGSQPGGPAQGQAEGASRPAGIQAALGAELKKRLGGRIGTKPSR